MTVLLSIYSTFAVARVYVGKMAIVGYAGPDTSIADTMADLRRALHVAGVRESWDRIIETDYREDLNHES